MSVLNERAIIDIFVSNLGLRGNNGRRDDDVSIVSLRNMKRMKSLIIKCDMLVESTDVPQGMYPWQIARKSISACVSDLSAKGIKPYVSVISVGIPKKYSKTEIEDLANGFQIASKEFGVKIVGGDTNESKELIIDCSMIGFSENYVSELPGRNGAKPGDLVVVSGEFGYTLSGLKILTKKATASGEFKNNAITSVKKPKPAQKFGISLAKYFSASMDSSDGLSITLYELARQSNANFVIDNIPSAKGVFNFARNNHLDYKRLIFCGGEEYEIVGTISRANLKKAKATARRLNLKLLIIGKVEKGESKVFLLDRKTGKRVQLENTGYVHLNDRRKSG
ncbi:MAG TPA: thiamine-phosphate kinase [Candidatus Nitrosopolaris sp.]|nr:thiamine-phosphate kinase [Candidatus Nitrosopolaris sp.]